MQIQPCCYTSTNLCFSICVMGIVVLPYLQVRGDMQQAMYLAQWLAHGRCSMNFSVYVCVHGCVYVPWAPDSPLLWFWVVFFFFFTTYQFEYHRANHLCLFKHPDNLFHHLLFPLFLTSSIPFHFFIPFCNFHVLCPFLKVYDNNIP